MTVTYKEHPESALAEVTVNGNLTEADFDRIAPLLEAFIARCGKVKILEIIDGFPGFDAAVIKKGAAFDIKHLKHLTHCAVVTDSRAIGFFTRLLSPLFSVEIRVYKAAEEAEARKWLTEA